MPKDKKTIGLTPETQEIMDQIMESELFSDQNDAAKFALSVAINQGIEPGKTEGTSTKWGIGTFDTDGELRTLIPALYPDVETPYRVVEHLINQGLMKIKKFMGKSSSFDLMSVLEKQSSEKPS